MSIAFSTAEERRYRFDEFEVDPVRRLLLRDGEPVAITPKALAILVVLLENQGKVVVKESLIKQVWGGGYVSDANLTQNVSFLRKALGERAGDHRFIVTVPGQGYCFAAALNETAAVETAEEPAAVVFPPPEVSEASAAPAVSAASLPPPEETVPSAVSGGVSSPGQPHRSWVRIGAGLAILLLVLSLSVLLPRLERGPLVAPEDLVGGAAASRGPSIAVLGLKNLSGDRSYDWLGSALAEMLTTELAAGSRVRVISRENVALARGSFDFLNARDPNGAMLTEIRSKLGADLLVSGSYLALGQGSDRRIRLDLRVVRESTQDTVTSLAEVGNESELFELVSRTGAKLRQGLGFGDPSPAQAQAARALQPASSEAVRLYAEGLERLRSYDAPRALELLRQAAEADPGSAVVRSALAAALKEMGHDAPAAAEAQRAFELSGALPRDARLAIEARFHELNQRWSKAIDIYGSLRTFYPEDPDYGLQLAMCQMRGGSAAEALQTISSLRQLPVPEGMDPRIDILEARIALRLSDFPRQKRAAEAAVAKGWHSGEELVVAQGLVYQGDALSTMGEHEKAIRVFQQAQKLATAGNHPYISGKALSYLGSELRTRGDLDGAERAQRQALAAAERLGSDSGIASQLQTLGQLYQDRGELPKALDYLDRSRVLFAQLGDRMMETRSLIAVARVKWLQGDFAGAREASELALRISRELGSRREEAEALNQLGRTLTWQNDPVGALRRHEEAFILFRQIGDLNQAASALADSGGVTARLNDMPGARRRYRHALLIKRRTGDRVGMAEILDRLAGLSYREGDITRSRRLSEWVLRIVEETGVRNLLAKSLTRLGRAEWASGQFAEARVTLEQALVLSTERNEEMEKLAIQLYLAGLSVSERRLAEAETRAAKAAAGYRAKGMDGSEVQALAVLAEALLLQGKLPEARQAAERARELIAGSDASEIRALVFSRIAYVDAAEGRVDRALRDLRLHTAQAKAGGYGSAYLQARLALGEVLLAADEKAGRATLLEVRRDAAGLGFVVLARSAAEALESGGVLAEWKASPQARP